MTMTRKPYCTLDDVKAASDVRTTTDDDFISSLILQAQTAIDERLGYSFQTDGTVAVPATRTFNGNMRPQMLIDRCISIASVTIQTYLIGTDLISGALTRTANPPIDITADVLLGPPNRSPQYLMERISGANFDLGRQNIVVTGIWGVATVPPDINRACTRLAIHYLKQRDNSYQDQTGSAQYGALTFRQQIPADICELLDKRARRVYRG